MFASLFYRITNGHKLLILVATYVNEHTYIELSKNAEKRGLFETMKMIIFMVFFPLVHPGSISCSRCKGFSSSQHNEGKYVLRSSERVQ